VIGVTDTNINLLPKNGLSRDVWMSLEQLQENIDTVTCVRYSEMRIDFCARIASICPFKVPVVQLEPAHL
jgi:hypothetical protein